MRPKQWIAFAVLPALLLGGDFFYWLAAVNQLRAGFETWTRQARNAGWDVRHGAVTASGWPDAATLRVKNLTVLSTGVFENGAMNFGALHLSGVTCESDEVLIGTGLTRPGVLDVTIVGKAALQLNSGPRIPLSADHMRVRLTMHQNAYPKVVDLVADALIAEMPGLGPVRVGRLTAHADMYAAAGRDQASATLSVHAQPVVLPDRLHLGPGPEVSEFELDGVLYGLVSPEGRSRSQRLTERATFWRDGGGSLELRRLSIGWGPARLDASATLALDDDLQPMGAGTSKLVGYNAALDLLAAKAVLTRSAAQAAKAMLSLMGNTPADGEPEEAEVPLTLQFRTLSVRQVPLIRLPELDWPDR